MSSAPCAIRSRPARAPERRRVAPRSALPSLARPGCRRAPPRPRRARCVSASTGRRQRADRRLAAAAERFDQRPLGLERRRWHPHRRSGRRSARTRVVARADFDRRRCPGRAPARTRSPAASSKCATPTRAAAGRPRPARSRRGRRRRAFAGACRGCRESGANRAPREQARELRDAAHAARADLRRWPERRDRESSSVACRLPAAASSALTGSTTASSGSSRGSTPAIARPSGSSAGMSLLLWTARSIVVPEQRVFDFLDEEPLAADFRQRPVLQRDRPTS